LKFYEYTDADGDSLIVGTLIDGRLMFTVESSPNRRPQVVLTAAEARELYREMGRALGCGDAPQPLTEERVRRIAQEEARQVFALGSRRPS
jgi:hypothetical protein